MKRPLISHRIEQMEGLFESSRKDTFRLRQLETELTFRQTPRAAALLIKVRRVLGGDPAPTVAEQKDLFGDPIPTGSPRPILSNRVSEPTVAQIVSRNSPEPAQAVSTADIENAYKTLRVTRTSTWEAIENSRRQIVDRARPDFILDLDVREREARRQEAIRANAAYLVIARTKAQ